jgi:hypothetical protein
MEEKQTVAGGIMHQKYEEYVTPTVCQMHHQIMEGQLELLRQKDKTLEDKMMGIEKRIDIMDGKIDSILKTIHDLNLNLIANQATLQKYALWFAIGIGLTLFGVLTGRALDFGWLI